MTKQQYKLCGFAVSHQRY